MGVAIREAGRADFPAIVSIWKEMGIAWPERAVSVAAMESAETRRSPKRLCRRWLAVCDGEESGFCSLVETDSYNGRRAFSVNVAVRRRFRRRGLGAGLFGRADSAAAEFAGGILMADGYTIEPEGMRFLTSRGFRESWRETPVELDVGAADVSRLPALLLALEGRGFKIRSLGELAGDPERDRRLYELYDRAKRLVPTEDGYVWERQDYAEWRSEQIEDPSVLHDAYLVALHGEDYVGLKEVGMIEGSGAIQCGLMAVLPAFRRNGLALAMQLRAIDYAKSLACPRLKSCTATVNRPMLELYDKLGYRRLYEWAQYLRDIP